MSFEPRRIRIGGDAADARLVLDVLDYVHPDRAEPEGLDVMSCRVEAHASRVDAAFDIELRLDELVAVRDYLRSIGTGNGPQAAFALAGGLLTVSFAPSKRGPVLCAVLLKTIDASHVRLEYLITLEPSDIGRTSAELDALFTSRA